MKRRPRQRISPAPRRPPGGSPPSLRPRTGFSHRPFMSSTSVATNSSSITREGPWRSAITVGCVAALEFVAVPELPNVVFAPALDAPIVLRSAASFMHPDAGAGCLQGVSQGPVDPQTCQQQCRRRVSLATATARVSSAAPPLWPMCGWIIPQ